MNNVKAWAVLAGVVLAVLHVIHAGPAAVSLGVASMSRGAVAARV